jgi:hypothetical protein
LVAGLGAERPCAFLARALRTADQFVLGIIALVLALIAGWLGGELVERLGVGVDEGAHLNAPNSLSGEAARQA